MTGNWPAHGWPTHPWPVHCATCGARTFLYDLTGDLAVHIMRVDRPRPDDDRALEEYLSWRSETLCDGTDSMESIGEVSSR